MVLEPINEKNRAHATAFIQEHWFTTEMALRGEYGIPLRHELELEMPLDI